MIRALILGLLVLVAACGDRDSTPDSGMVDSGARRDASADAGADASGDARADAAADVGPVDSGEHPDAEEPSDSGEHPDAEEPADSGEHPDAEEPSDSGEHPDAEEPADSGEPADATEPEDTGPADTGPADTGPEDTGPADTGPPDSGLPVCGNGVVEELFELCEPSLEECCNSTCDGFQPEGTACSSCPEGDYCAGCFGGDCADSRTFCADLLARGLSTGDGIYEISPAATASVTAATSTVSVYCDMTTSGGGWTMVFKKSRTDPTSAELLWYGAALNAGDLTYLDRAVEVEDYTNAFQSNYWGAFTEARVEVVTGTIAQKFVQFDLTGTTNANWFAPQRWTASSWTDLPTSPTFDNGMNQAFRIGSGRSFYINRVWSGCPSDRGWLMVSTIDFCFWENSSGNPADIMYSRLTTESHIPNTTQTGFADTMVIFLR